MKPTKITLSNFRKGNLTLADLEAINILRGPNGSGKTRVSDAIKFALKGRVGELKTTSAIFNAYATGDHMEVRFDIGDHTIVRGIENKIKIDKETGEKSYKLSSVDSIVLNETNKEITSGRDNVQAWIDAELFIDDNVLDFSEFETLDVVGKRQYLVKCMETEKVLMPDVIDYISFNANVDYMEDDYKEIFLEQLKELERGCDKNNILESMIKVANTNKKFYNADKKEKRGAANTAMQYKADVKGNVGKLDRLEPKLKEYNDKKQQLEIDRVTALRSIKSKEINTADVERIKEKIANISEARNEDRIKSLEESIADLTSKIEAEKEVTPPSRDVIEDQHNTINAVASELETIHDECGELTLGITDRIDKRDNLTRRLESLTGEKPICPILGIQCGQDFTGVVEELYSDIIKLTDIVASMKIKYDNLRIKAKEKEEELEKQQAIREGMVEAYSMKVGAYNASMELNSEMISRRQNLRDELNELKSVDNSRSARIEELEVQLAELEKFVPEAFTPLEKLDTQAVIILDKIDELTAEITSLKEKKAALELQNKADMDCAISEYKHMAWTKIKELLGEKGFIGDMIKRQTEPIIATMNRYLETFNRTEAFYIDLVTPQGRDTLDFGWIRGDEKISYVSLSGAESMINALAMVCTFQILNPHPYSIVLIDEINILFGDYFEDVLDGIYDSPIDFVVAAGAFDTAYDMDGFKVYEMGDY